MAKKKAVSKKVAKKVTKKSQAAKSSPVATQEAKTSSTDTGKVSKKTDVSKKSSKASPVGVNLTIRQAKLLENKLSLAGRRAAWFNQKVEAAEARSVAK